MQANFTWCQVTGGFTTVIYHLGFRICVVLDLPKGQQGLAGTSLRIHAERSFAHDVTLTLQLVCCREGINSRRCQRQSKGTSLLLRAIINTSARREDPRKNRSRLVFFLGDSQIHQLLVRRVFCHNGTSLSWILSKEESWRPYHLNAPPHMHLGGWMYRRS
jgi:hypothetical protein